MKIIIMKRKEMMKIIIKIIYLSLYYISKEKEIKIHKIKTLINI